MEKNKKIRNFQLGDRRGLISVSAAACLCAAAAGAGGEPAAENSAPDPYADLHPLAQAVARAGAPACAAKVTEAAFFLTEGASATAFWNFRSAELLSFSLEVVSPDRVTSYVSLNIAPGEDGACVIGYDAVMHWASDCETVARIVHPGMRTAGTQPGSMAMLKGGDSEYLFLMPAGQGCVAIKKEVFP